MQLSYVYILLCKDNSYYVGGTNDVFRRFSYTFINRRSLKLVFHATFRSIEIAIQKEKQIKKWSRAKKLALIEDRFEDLPNLAKKNFSNNSKTSNRSFLDTILISFLIKITRNDG